jgi:hypothetical protein
MRPRSLSLERLHSLLVDGGASEMHRRGSIVGPNGSLFAWGLPQMDRTPRFEPERGVRFGLA